MPYEREFASKSSHRDIIGNPEVISFLEGCEYLTPPSDEESARISASFINPDRSEDVVSPEHAIAVDGSVFEAAQDDRLPSSRVGYVKIGGVVVSLSDFDGLRAESDERFVDPFKMAALEDDNWPLTFPMPSSNVRVRGSQSVRDSFRKVMDLHFSDEKTRFEATDPNTSLRATLFELFALRVGFDCQPGELKIPRCPTCRHPDVIVSYDRTDQDCPVCGEAVYATDCLRIWEEVDEVQSNHVALLRFMNIVEHLLPIHYMRYLMIHAPSRVSRVAFFVDGPLAIFGTAAWLHASILKFINNTNELLNSRGELSLLIVGLQKTGQVSEFFKFVDPFIPQDRLLCLDDEFRHRHVITGRDPSSNGFGAETYYGQDFLYKTPTGKLFVFGIPYSFGRKSDSGNFASEKVEVDRYDRLADTLALIDHFETDLYENAVVPIALAHRYTAISLVPGGSVLNLLTAESLSS